MAFTDEQIVAVWAKGRIVEGYDASKWRKDVAGAWMTRSRYGEEHLYGWEIDHVFPEAKGGDDNLVNLRPMQWDNNRSKSDDYPEYSYVKVADGNKNVDTSGTKIVHDDLQAKLSELY